MKTTDLLVHYVTTTKLTALMNTVHLRIVVQTCSSHLTVPVRPAIWPCVLLSLLFNTMLPVAGSAQNAESQSDDDSWKWPVTSPVPVCWFNPVTADDSLYVEEVRKMGLVKDIVTNEWEKFSALSFSGWEKCGAGSENGIQINIMWNSQRGDVNSSGNVNPNSQLGRYNIQTRQTTGFGDPDEIRPAMALQFDESDYYIVSSALHEFGHALGFSHEHRRTNDEGELVSDPICQAIHPPKVGDTIRTNPRFLSDEYDANSIMSYCPFFGSFFNAISEKDALGIQKYYGPGEKGPILKAAEFTSYLYCDGKYRSGNGKGTAFLHIWDGNCWSCPPGYGRTLDPNVAGDGACMKGGETLRSSATYEGLATGIFRTDCKSGQFLHGLSGKCYSCPEGYGRTLAGIDAWNACEKVLPAAYSAATLRGRPGCAEGSFEHGVLRERACYSCGDGYDRTLIPAQDLRKEPKACVLRDWGLTRMVTLPWRILQITN